MESDDSEASFKYGTPDSILVSTATGLIEIACPFRVKYRDEYNQKTLGQEFLITRVGVHAAFDIMIFKNGDDWEGHFMFEIII